MNEFRHVNFLRLRNVRRPNEPPPTPVQRGLAIALWLGTLVLASVILGFKVERIDWPQMAILLTTHFLAGLLSVRLPRGFYVGFVLTNLLSIGLVFGISRVMEVALISSGFVAPLLVGVAHLIRGRRSTPFVQLYEVMYTSVSNALAAAGAIAMFQQIGGTASLIEVPHLAVLAVSAFSISSLFILVWQAAGRANILTLLQQYWLIILVSNFGSIIGVPVIAVYYMIERDVGYGVLAFLIGTLLLYMFNSIYLDQMRRSANLAVLNSIGLALSAKLEFDDLLRTLRLEIGKLLDVSGFYLALVNEEKQEISFPIDYEDNKAVHFDPVPLHGTSLTAHIIRTRRPFLTAREDAGILARLGVVPVGRITRSYAAVPVFSGQQVIGVMALRSYVLEDLFDEDVITLLQQVATQVGIAIQNARLFRESQRQASELSSLQEVSSLMTASTDVKGLIRAICRIVVDVMGYQKTAVFLLNSQRTVARLVESIGLSQEYIEVSQAVSLDHARTEVFKSGKPVLIDNIRTDPRYSELKGLAELEGIELVVEVPLTLGNQIIGSLAAYSNLARQVTTNEVNLLQTLSAQIAVAVANTQLFEATAERGRELETLYEASATVSSSLSLKNVLRALSVNMIHALHVPNCNVWLATEDQKALRAGLRMIELDGGANEEPIIAVTLELEDMPTIQKAVVHHSPATLKFNSPDLSIAEQRLLYQCRITSGLVLPLVMHNILHGLIVIPSSDADHDFNNEQTRLAAGLAHQAAVAIDNARRFERTDVALSRRLEEMSALERISQRIASHLNLREVLDEVAQAALENTGSEFIDVALLDDHNRTLQAFIRRSAIPDQDTASSWPASTGLTGRAIRTRLLVNVGDVLGDPDYTRVRENVISELVAPIVLEDTVLGVINLESIRPNAFSEDHARFATNLAEHSAIAIYNANLFESERRQRQIAELLLETSGIVASSPNLTEVLLTLSEQLLRISGFQGCSILEIDEQTGQAYTLAEHVHCIWPEEKSRVYNVEEFPLTKKVLEMGQPCSVHKTMESPDIAELNFMTQLSTEALLMLPIRSRDRIIGLVEVNSTTPEMAFDTYTIDNAVSILDEAAGWLIPPLRANPAARLLELAGQLYRASGHHFCTLSEWDEPAGLLSTAVVFGDLVWQSGKGPGYQISDYPELVEVLQTGNSRLFQIHRKGPLSELGPSSYRSYRGDHALVIQPLSRKGNPIGVVELFSVANVTSVRDDDLRIWRLVADQASVAIENARLFEAIQRRGEEFSTLRTVAVETTMSPDLASTLRVISRHALERTGAIDVQIYLYDPATDQLSFGAAVQRSTESLRPLAAPRHDGLTATVARTGDRMIASDLAKHPMFSELSSQEEWSPVKTIMGVPLKSGDEVLGVFNISFDDERAVDDDLIHFLDLLAAQAAITIGNTRLADATRTGRDRLQAILDSSYDGILLLDPEGHLLLANPRAEFLVNVVLSDKIGWHVLDIAKQLRGHTADQEDNYILREVIRQARFISKDVMATTRHRYILSNPTRAVEAVSNAVQGRNEELVGRLVILHDVTYQMEIEAYRQEMSSMIVHDLRSPLSSLITGLEMALGEIGIMTEDAHTNVLKVTLGVGMNSANSLLKLVDGILDVSKLEAGEVPLTLSPINLREVIRQACDRLQPVAQGANIALKMKTPAELPEIVADGEKIERVIVNLVDNALRYCPQGGKVTVTAARASNFYTVSVMDTGEGIPEEYREHIFERFFQINPKGRRRGARGTGLGLTFCRLAVEAHTGRIWVDDAPGGGAAFHFTLPTTLAEPQQRTPVGAS